ncbi:TetR/AcrR family transcriptional regulator C-terminal domain-containing protein [Nocardia sp. NPDC005978]|uniref:TetR/AcrR family transcriptional regulator n=1 Tax=Nocardia sp. NPDC005978 TaxID=3156725 RepID=UPI0033AEBD69
MTESRGRGRPNKIDRERILAAARGLAPEAVTMQAVANALGVDRKALNYYVSDRHGLLELVALDAFESAFRRVDLRSDPDWRGVLRSCARAMREAFLSVGALISYARFEGMTDMAALGIIEQTLRALVDAGLAVDDAGRTITLVARLAQAAAHETHNAAPGSGTQQAGDILRALNDTAHEQFSLLSRVANTRSTQPLPDGQFDFELTLVITALETELGRGDRSQPSHADN